MMSTDEKKSAGSQRADNVTTRYSAVKQNTDEKDPKSEKEFEKKWTSEQVEKAVEYHNNVIDAYASYAFTDTLIFAFSLQFFSEYGNDEWESTILEGVYG
eukprot:406083_1